MHANSIPEPARFTRMCRVLRALVLLVVAILAAMLLWPLLLQLLLPQRGLNWLFLVRLLPALCYLWALWAVQHTLAEFAAGRLFQPAVARGLGRVGWGVLVGALLRTFAVSNLTRLLTHGHGAVAYFDPGTIVLGVVGAALVLLAHLIGQARRLQLELDEMI
ncbi:MAG TPA: DUF2975 domain-containing protein [Rhodanobacteraceae bacterium]|nr:DUF2975 domain-containing protein [Rhodanobacteraceae bacterium]